MIEKSHLIHLIFGGHHLHRGSFYELKKKSEVIFKNAIKVKQLFGNKTNIEKEYTKAVM